MTVLPLIASMLVLPACNEKKCDDPAEASAKGATTSPGRSLQGTLSAPVPFSLPVDGRCYVTSYGTLQVFATLTARITFPPDDGPEDPTVAALYAGAFREVYSAECELSTSKCRAATLNLAGLDRGEPLKSGSILVEQDAQVTKLSDFRYRITSKHGMPADIDLAEGKIHVASDSAKDHYRGEGTCIAKEPPKPTRP